MLKSLPHCLFFFFHFYHITCRNHVLAPIKQFSIDGGAATAAETATYLQFIEAVNGTIKQNGFGSFRNNFSRYIAVDVDVIVVLFNKWCLIYYFFRLPFFFIQTTPRHQRM